MEPTLEGSDHDVHLVLVTVSDVDSGCRLARRLVEERLVACGNVIAGLTSVYRWNGEVQEDKEALVLLKTREVALEALRKRVLELHAYEVPEFLTFPAAYGLEPYLRWVTEEVRLPDSSPWSEEPEREGR